MLKVCCSEEKKSRLKNIETAPTYFLISRKKNDKSLSYS